MDGANNVIICINEIKIKSTVNTFNKFIKHAKLVIYIIEYLKNKSNNKNDKINIYLILSKLTKIFPEKNEIIDVININSGFTNVSEHFIFIWREEEFEKVLFHELIHLFDMDSRDHHHDDVMTNIDGPYSCFEANTDFWGIMYHLIFLSLMTKIKIKTLIEIELGFIRNQASRCNNHFELNDWKNHPDKTITQKTPAFSYFILKYMLFDHVVHSETSNLENFNDLLEKILLKGFNNDFKFVKIASSRMTLLQLL